MSKLALDFDAAFVEATMRGLAALGAKTRHSILCQDCGNSFEVDVPIRQTIVTVCPICDSVRQVRG